MPNFFARPLSACLKTATVALAIFASTTSLKANDPAPTPIQATTVEPALCQPSKMDDTLFADEIIRRLRRIGLNFTRFRLPRPYDPAGELC